MALRSDVRSFLASSGRIAAGAWLLAAAALFVPGSRASAQAPDSLDARRPQATRQELVSALEELQKIISSSGYSGNLRKAKEAEAVLLQQRLTEGDFQVGDQIEVTVIGEPTLTGRFTVLPDRKLAFPQLAPISLQGVLRSEASQYLTTEIGKYVKNPQVTIQASYIRLAITGAVTKPGYYTIPADYLVSDAIMNAGGPLAGVDLGKSIVKRNDKEVIGREQLRASLAGGVSLDQLNLHGGDELVVGGTSLPPSATGGLPRWFLPVQAVLGTAVLVATLFLR